ncbi:hypothetical protein Tco_1543317 [Tanacetum coccineum]
MTSSRSRESSRTLPTSYLDAGVVRHNLLRGGSSASGISFLRSTGGMNNKSGSSGSGDDDRGSSGGDGSGNDAGTSGGNGDEALNLPMAALKPGCTHMVRATIWVR